MLEKLKGFTIRKVLSVLSACKLCGSQEYAAIKALDRTNWVCAKCGAIIAMHTMAEAHSPTHEPIHESPMIFESNAISGIDESQYNEWPYVSKRLHFHQIPNIGPPYAATVYTTGNLLLFRLTAVVYVWLERAIDALDRDFIARRKDAERRTLRADWEAIDLAANALLDVGAVRQARATKGEIVLPQPPQG